MGISVDVMGIHVDVMGVRVYVMGTTCVYDGSLWRCVCPCHLWHKEDP